jgi:hypothetical protein
MTTFKLQTIPYEDVAAIISKLFAHWSPAEFVEIDETQLTTDDFVLLKRYLEQENYKVIS